MKDLKHLKYFEDLLEDINNDLVRQAQAEGKLALGYTCFHAPEVLMNLDNCFSVRLRAPHTESLEMSTYYMANNSCEYARALLERAIEGSLSFLDAMIGVDVCEANNRAIENMEILKTQGEDKHNFFFSNLDIPYSDDEDCVLHLTEQVTRKILKPLHERYGVDISDAKVREAVALHNEVCRIITELAEYKKPELPSITGYEFHVITLCTYVCPKWLIIDKLRETLEEVKNRKPDSKKFYRVRVALVGSEIDDPNVIRLIEDAGAFVVVDRFCFGSLPGRQEIILNDEEDAVKQICRQNLMATRCPRQCAKHCVDRRYDDVARLVKEFNADGAIYEQMKFCTYWSYERTMASHIMPEEYDVITLSIDRPYIVGNSGQLRTRIQAFVESLEIKKLHHKKEGK